MNKLTKEEQAKIMAEIKKDPNYKDGTLVINSSSKMSNFCKETAAGIALFYREDYYPLSMAELKPFLKQITKEFKKLFKESSQT